MADDGSPAPREFHPVTDPGAPAARPAIDSLIERLNRYEQHWNRQVEPSEPLIGLVRDCRTALQAPLALRVPRAAIQRALARVVADGGEERFISDGYEANEAIIDAVCEELRADADDRAPARQHEVVRALTDTARRAVDGLRDFAREQGMTHFRRDPLVMDIHRALDAFDEAAALAPPTDKASR